MYRRARIFENRPVPFSASSDVHDPSGHRATPPLLRWMAHDGLCSLRIICKSASCCKLTCVINADLVAISYVDASCYLDRVMHEVVTSTAVGRASRHVHFALQWCRACVEKCVLCV